MDPFVLLVVLACPIGMGLMMWLMNKNMAGQSEPVSPDKQKLTSPAHHLAALQDQRQRLEAEIVELSQIVELEDQRDALLIASPPAPDDTPISAMSR